MRYRLLALLSLAAALVAGSQTAAAPDAAQTTNHAGIVVQFGNGQVATACVAFAGPSINGWTLLQQSGLDVVAEDVGGNAAVCRIGQQGCAFPTEACFCQCPGGTACRYWTYWHLSSGQWRFSSVGASSSEVQAGGVDGWSWGAGTVAGGSQPPPTTFDRICALPVPATASPVRPRPSATTAPLTLPPTLTRPRLLPTANTLPPAPPLPTADVSPPRPPLTATPSSQSSRAPATGTPPTPTVPAPSPTLPAVAPPPVTTDAGTGLPSPTTAGTPEATPLPPALTPVASATSPMVAAAISVTPPSEQATQPVVDTTGVAGVAGQRSGVPASSSLAGYLLFGVLLLVLIGATVIVQRRRS